MPGVVPLPASAGIIIAGTFSEPDCKVRDAVKKEGFTLWVRFLLQADKEIQEMKY